MYNQYCILLAMFQGTNGSAFHFVPVVDRNVLPDTPETLISKRKVLPVPWLTGRVRDEGLMGFTGHAVLSHA